MYKSYSLCVKLKCILMVFAGDLWWESPVVRPLLHSSTSTLFKELNLCVHLFQVGDDHPHLYVRNLHNHHEVSLILFPLIFPHLCPLEKPLKSQPVVYVCVCVGSTGLCTAWWRLTAAGQVSPVWAACGAPRPWAAWQTVTMTWCRWSQVQEFVFVRVHVYIQHIKPSISLSSSLSRARSSANPLTHFQLPVCSPVDFPQAEIDDWN